TVPDGFPPGSDVANLSVMGYSPAEYYTGRAPLEAAAMGVALAEGDIAFRCNFVTIEMGIMKDYSAGHISSEEGRDLIEALKPMMPGMRLYAGVSYRNLLVLRSGGDAVCTPPHDISDRPVAEHLPTGPEGGEGGSLPGSGPPMRYGSGGRGRLLQCHPSPRNTGSPGP
ncbi:MAG: phosphoglycerate mutase, partial [Methanothrix sp.]|nr:phosphoglycerate mutase [Methanothrix sp.]